MAQDTRTYNMTDNVGWSPIFLTSSLEVIEVLLAFDDMDVMRRDGMPLHRRCAQRGAVSEKVANDERLQGQYALRWESAIPLEVGKHRIN